MNNTRLYEDLDMVVLCRVEEECEGVTNPKRILGKTCSVRVLGYARLDVGSESLRLGNKMELEDESTGFEAHTS